MAARTANGLISTAAAIIVPDHFGRSSRAYTIDHTQSASTGKLIWPCSMLFPMRRNSRAIGTATSAADSWRDRPNSITPAPMMNAINPHALKTNHKPCAACLGSRANGAKAIAFIGWIDREPVKDPMARAVVDEEVALDAQDGRKSQPCEVDPQREPRQTPRAFGVDSSHCGREARFT